MSLKLDLPPWRPEMDLFNPEFNLGLAREWLEYDPFGDREPDTLRNIPVFEFAVVRGKRKYHYQPDLLKPLPWTRHPTATAYWDANLPDHCPGALIVYPIAYAIDRGFYSQATLVVCHHFEFGDETEDYVYLHEYSRLLAMDLWRVRDGEARIAAIHPNAEILIMTVIPPYWLEEEDNPAWDLGLLQSTPEKAIESLVKARR